MVGVREEKKYMEWNITKISKKLLEYKHKKEALERDKELWLMEQKTKTNTINKMFMQII
jgi:hypothetical protein